MGRVFEVGEIVTVQFGHLSDPAHESSVQCKVKLRKLSNLGLWRAKTNPEYQIADHDYVYQIERLDNKEYLGSAIFPEEHGFLLRTAQLYATNTGHPAKESMSSICNVECRPGTMPCLSCSAARAQLNKLRIQTAYGKSGF